MLRSIRLQNFRSLRDTGDVELRPIVLLVGANSSGKSSFLRFFPLLKQTTQANSRSPLLWFREERGLVDFGDFETTLTRGASVPEIIVSGEVHGQSLHNEAGESANYRFHSHIAARDGHSYVHKFELDCLDDHLVAAFDPVRGLTSLHVADITINEDMPEALCDALIPALNHTSLSELAHELIQKKIAEQVADPSNLRKVEGLAWNVNFGSNDSIRRALLEVYDGPSKWKNVHALTPDYLRHLKRLALLRAVGASLDGWHPMSQLTRSLSDLANGVRYIGPFRRAPARFYRPQEVAVDEIDATGSNLAMFLFSLEESDRLAFSGWVYEHFGFHVRAERREAQVVLRVGTGTKSDFDLTDMGFGISQLLPVAAQCWLSSQRRQSPGRGRIAPSLLAIEQPELHLHPHHQFQLADMFLGLANAARDTQQSLTLCIETHSEAMIHRFGELVEEDPRRREDITILFFEKAPDSDVSSVRKIEFDAEGMLQNWPIGFFRG